LPENGTSLSITPTAALHRSFEQANGNIHADHLWFCRELKDLLKALNQPVPRIT